MKRIAIIGGGIAGLSAAFFLEKARRAGADLQWILFEKSGRLGGVIQTERRDGGNEVTEKPQELRKRQVQQIPFGQPPACEAVLPQDELAEIEGAGQQQDADYRERQRQFVADHLRRTAQAAEKRILAIRRPTGQRDAVNANRRHSEHVKQRYIKSRNDELNCFIY